MFYGYRPPNEAPVHENGLIYGLPPPFAKYTPAVSNCLARGDDRRRRVHPRTRVGGGARRRQVVDSTTQDTVGGAGESEANEVLLRHHHRPTFLLIHPQKAPDLWIPAA